MNSKLAIGGLVVVILAVAGWFFVSPLFIDRTVDEPLPVASIPDVRTLSQMSADKREILMAELMKQAGAADIEVSEAMDMPTVPGLVATGNFFDADAIHRGEGSARFYELEDGGHLLRFENFRVTNGPALVVLLARAPDPKSAKEVKRGYVKIGELKGNVGNQNYEISSEVDIYRLGSVVIWCELFDVLFSAAPIKLL